MANKKICILTTVHPASDPRIFHKQAKTLINAGYDVSLIAQHEENIIVDGIKITALPKTKNRLQRMLRLPLRALLLSLKNKADVYHFHDPELIPVGVVLKILGKKIIYDVHEDYAKQILSKEYLPRITKNSIAIFFNILDHIFSSFFDGIVTATDDILKNFSSHKKAISLRNFPLISNYLNIDRNSNSKKNVFDLIYSGVIVARRGINQIVKALELIDSKKQLKLTLCGKFNPPEYAEEVESLERFEKVEYLGWVDPYAIPKLLRRSEIGIVNFLPEPNHIRSMPNKLFEYMEASLPVIASNFPLWKKIVEGNKCGVCVDPLKPKDIAKAIDYLIEQPKLRKEMGENGRNAVLEKYNWEKESEKLINLYGELLKKVEQSL